MRNPALNLTQQERDTIRAYLRSTWAGGDFVTHQIKISDLVKSKGAWIKDVTVAQMDAAEGKLGAPLCPGCAERMREEDVLVNFAPARGWFCKNEDCTGGLPTDSCTNCGALSVWDVSLDEYVCTNPNCRGEDHASGLDECLECGAHLRHTPMSGIHCTNPDCPTNKEASA